MTEDASKENLRHRLAEKMAGEITLSDKPGEALKTFMLGRCYTGKPIHNG